MSYIKFPFKDLEHYCLDVFEKFGFNRRESEIITDVLLTSDLFNIESHGFQRLVRYYKAIQGGRVIVDAKPETVFETDITAVLDGHDGMGQLVAYQGMSMAIEKAKKHGVGIVSVRESNHFGIAGYYAKMASDAGFLGLSFSNAEAIMVPTFGSLAMIGSNPIACAMPADPVNFLFDASTCVVTAGKLEMYNKMGKPIPEGWAMGNDGRPNTDAPFVLSNIHAKRGGGLLPLGGATETFGGHKGYGFGLLCEIFTSILSQGLTSNYCMVGSKGGICHGFMAINPAFFGDPQAIKAHLSTYLEEIRNSPKGEGHNRIYTHGEKEAEAYKDRLENGIPVNENTLVEILDICEYLKMDFSAYFGDYRPSDEMRASFHSVWA